MTVIELTSIEIFTFGLGCVSKKIILSCFGWDCGSMEFFVGYASDLDLTSKIHVELQVDRHYFVVFLSCYDSIELLFYQVLVDLKWNFEVQVRIYVVGNNFVRFGSG